MIESEIGEEINELLEWIECLIDEGIVRPQSVKLLRRIFQNVEHSLLPRRQGMCTREHFPLTRWRVT